MTKSLPRCGILSVQSEPCHAGATARPRQLVTGSASALRMLSINDVRSRNARASFGSSAVRRSCSWFFLRTAGSFPPAAVVANSVGLTVLDRNVASLRLSLSRTPVAPRNGRAAFGEIQRVARQIIVMAIGVHSAESRRDRPLRHLYATRGARCRRSCRRSRIPSVRNACSFCCNTWAGAIRRRSRSPWSGSARASGRAVRASGTGSTTRRDRRRSCARCSRAGGSRRRPRC